MSTLNRWPEPRSHRLSQYFAELEEAAEDFWNTHGTPSALVDDLDFDQDEPRDMFGHEAGGDR